MTSVEITLDTQDITFDLSMGLFIDETFQSILPEDAVINIPELLFAQVLLEDGPSNLVLQGKQCWATPS
jgi:hypothetical protein